MGLGSPVRYLDMSTNGQESYELVPDDPFRLPEDPDSLPMGIKAQMAFKLRKAGASYELIAEKLNYASPGSAQSTIARILKNNYKPDDVDEVMLMELQRLDALQLVAWRRAREGDLKAIDRILKIMERRSDYLGLDAPEPVDATVTHNTAIFIGGDEQEYIAKLKQAREVAVDTVRRLGSGQAQEQEGRAAGDAGEPDG